jgi:LuxR family maltose regulon positive regulatory protein
MRRSSAGAAKIISRIISLATDFTHHGERSHRWRGRIRKVPTSPDDLESPTENAIRAGLESGDLDRVEALSDALWYDLASRFAPEVLRAVEGIPASAFDARPRLLHAVLLAYQRMSYTEGDPRPLRRALQYYVVAGQRYGKRLPSLVRPTDLITAGTAAVVSGRVRGDYKGAEMLGAWTDAQVTVGTAQSTPPWLAARAAARPGWLSAERGLTATLAGSLDRATKLFTRAHDEAGDPPYAHYAGAGAVANLALLAAYRGQLDLARAWLTTLERSGPVPDWIEHLTAVGGRVAQALIAITEGDPVTAAELLDRIGPATQDMELWPFVAYADASYETHFGDPHKGLRTLDAARQQHGFLRPDPATMTGELVLRAEAELLLRVGAGARVLHLADRHGLTVYDALYLQLALDVEGELATLDRDLAKAGPDLTDTFHGLNRLFNIGAHNPNGNEGLTGDLAKDRARDEGYLYWLAWTGQNTVSLFSTSDAQGPFRRLFLGGVNCNTFTGEGLPKVVADTLGDAGVCAK